MPKLNWTIVGYNVTEAREQLEKIEKEIKEGTIAEGKFRVDLEHAFHHLSVAWNVRRASMKAYKDMSDEDFNRLSQFPAELEPFKV
jgi:CRISPR/Cas system-associated protein Cas10 (large subunit of type III CRISPR-Cas system)